MTLRNDFGAVAQISAQTRVVGGGAGGAGAGGGVPPDARGRGLAFARFAAARIASVGLSPIRSR
uniref:hypothetical protein n=1 Tax=Nocardia brasiliensis TaxID=37326 RepID=UPI002459116B